MRRVLIYEINEVPWAIWDLYTAARPDSNMARLLDRGMQRTTIDDDPVMLMPWRTWPTFHRSVYTEEHNAFDQGQDPGSFRGTPLWDVVDEAGLPVGLFGVLQSWPPREFRGGGFFVPDSFAQSPAAYPRSLERFQAFNVAMTNENAFAATRQLGPARLAGVGLDLIRHGLTPWSTYQAAAHIVAERREPRRMASRATVQVLPCFDLFWRLHRRHQPALSIFFSNHVASMMHRFWGDWVPGYESNGYEPDPVYRTFILQALDYFDQQLGRICRWIDRTPDSMLLIAGSIGQGPIEFFPMRESYVLDDPSALLTALGLQAEVGTAMYPRITFNFASPDAAEAAQPAVRAVQCALGSMFGDLRLRAASLSFEILHPLDVDHLERSVNWTDGTGRRHDGTIGDLGIAVSQRPGGGNTAQHTPDGALVAYGGAVDADRSRAKVDILDVAPSVLDLLGLAAAPDMRGVPSLFA